MHRSGTENGLGVAVTPRRHSDGVGGTTLRFATAAKAIADEARAAGLVVPGFRSPPRLAGVDRSLRRRSGAPPSVAVRLRDRALPCVVDDLVEGVIVANGLTGQRAARVRRSLRAAALPARAA